LEIGCGWGGFSMHAAKTYGCRVTGVTISQEQFNEATKRVKEAGLEHLIEIRFQDYRLITGQFDKIASIEMLEAVGEKYLETYFAKCAEVLAPHGILAVQMITVPDHHFRQLARGADWIQKHIFPGSLLLAVGRVNEAIRKTSTLSPLELEDLGSGYARTMREWFIEFNAKLDAGMKPMDALQLGFQTILCSPAFLHVHEGTGNLNDFALASRLSYFFWSSMPDQTLIQLATAGKLHEPATLSAQVDRLLADPKSQRFVQNFIRLWLNLDHIGEMPVSTDFVSFFRDNIDAAMRAETEMFFRHILDKNLPPREFLAANYTFLNRELALHYGLPPIEGVQLRQVTLPKGERGGLLTQASFLTASANGVDTSPVVRGVYVQHKLLGYTPPPPPPDVPIIEPDASGAKTIREQLAMHRENATCASCHQKIDPFGFALENFNAIGGWRTDYSGNHKIDSSGDLPTGEKFKDVTDFRTLLIARHEQFTRALTEKLLTYALGRAPEFTDRTAIDSIVKDMLTQGRGLRDLLHGIVASTAFNGN
jgi:hypothetical protein